MKKALGKIDNQNNDDIDAVARARAAEQLGIDTWVDGIEDIAHWRKVGSGKTLCGKQSGHIALNPQLAKPCRVCNDRLDEMITKSIANEVRNYWNRPAAGETFAATPKRRKAKVQYERLPLPDEYLPTGSGAHLELFGEVQP